MRMEVPSQKQTVNLTKTDKMKDFKRYFVIALAGLFLFPIGATAQTLPLTSQPKGNNIISCNAYDAITYNGHTIDEVNATEGNNSSVQSLWGTYSSVDEDENVWEKVFIYFNNAVVFNTERSRLTVIEIKDNQWAIKVLGKEIRVSDSFSELQQKFGSDLKIIYKPDINPNYAVSFNCSGNDFNGLLIDLSTETNKVVEIAYFKNP